MSIGANLNRGLSAIAGMMSSLRSSLMPSAMDCAQPCQPPTRMGPRRSCICADTLRSSQIRNIARTEITPIKAPATCKSAMVYQGIQVHDLRNGKINSAIVRSNQATHSTTPASSLRLRRRRAASLRAALPLSPPCSLPTLRQLDPLQISLAPGIRQPYHQNGQKYHHFNKDKRTSPFENHRPGENKDRLNIKNQKD